MFPDQLGRGRKTNIGPFGSNSVFDFAYDHYDSLDKSEIKYRKKTENKGKMKKRQ
jgi:hypothetical protein